MPLGSVPSLETAPSIVPNAIDFLEIAPIATVAVIVLFVFYKVIMKLCDIIQNKDI